MGRYCDEAQMARQACSQLSLRERMVIGIIMNKRANHIHKWIEEAHHPHHTDDIKYQVSRCSSTSLGICTEGCKIGRGSGTDVFTEHEGDTEIDGQHT